jgi:hypothetical protein
MITGGASAGLAAEAAWEILTLPQHIGAVAGRLQGDIEPWLRLTRGTFGYARDMGISGEEFRGQFFPGTALPGMAPLVTPQWRKATGLSSQEAVDVMSRFGFRAGRETEQLGMTQQLAGMEFLPGLGGFGAEAQQAARVGALTGATSPTQAGLQQFGMQFAHFMEDATAKGFDRATTAQSMEASLQAISRSGAAGVAVGDVQRFMLRMAGTPGGANGQAAQAAAQGVSSAWESIGSQPMRTQILNQAISGIKTEADLSRKLSPELVADIKQRPGGQKAIDYFLAANRRGDRPQALLWAQALARGDTEVETRLLTSSGITQSLQPGWEELGSSAAANISPMTLLAWRSNINITPTMAQAGEKLQNLPAEQLLYNKSEDDAGYERDLERMGIPPDVAKTMIAQGKAKGVSPVALAAVALREHPKGQWFGNIMQITPAGMKTAPPMQTEESIAQGAAHLQQDIAGGGTIHDVLRRYNGPKMDQMNPTYAGDVGSYMIAGNLTGNVPADQLARRAELSDAVMDASRTTFYELNTVVTLTGSALGALTNAVNTTTAAFNKLNRMTGYRGPADYNAIPQ